jgi:hypothetical protein
MTNSKINSGNITEHLGIVFVSINENGRCEITISEFKKLLAKSYQKGYEDASSLNSLSHTNTIPCEQNDNPAKLAPSFEIPAENWDKLGY